MKSQLGKKETNTRDASPEAATIETPKELSLAEQALEILISRCEGCHNSSSASISAFDFVTQIEKMIDEKYLVPGSTDESKLYQRIADGTMPPQGSPQLTQQEDEILEDWIVKGTPIALSRKDSEEEPRQFITRTALFTAAADDLQKLPASIRPNIRYFSSAHLYNSGEDGRTLEQAETGANKLINTFSNKKTLVRIQSVNSTSTLFRVNLTDFGISPPKWESVEIFYPYHYVANNESWLAYLQSQTQSTLPIMRIDWFLAAAGQPPLYYNMIETPENLPLLQQQLGINIKQNILQHKVHRAGFNNSMVAENHRVIERHETKNGFLWISYEFGEKTGTQNIFTNPLGPAGTYPLSTTSKQFSPGGHELFYSRPNSTIAFAVYNFEGQRMHEAPALIKDENKTITKVVAGKTCHICHGNGPIYKEDQVLSRMPSNLTITEQNEVLAIYKEHSVFQSKIEADSDSYQRAMTKIGIKAGQADPIASVSKIYEDHLSLARMASELSLSGVSFQRYLDENTDLLALVHACRVENTELYSRIEFQKRFKSIANLIW